MSDHNRKEKTAESRWTKFPRRFTGAITGLFRHSETLPCDHLPQKFSYIFRRKSKWELARISAVVGGIEMCYSAETAFATPVLLSLGLNVKYVSMIWCLSPLLAFMSIPILGSFSDNCNSRFGRRRPFIFALSMGVVLGLMFIPCGGRIGLLLGDRIDRYTESGQMTPHDLANSTGLTLLHLPRLSVLKAIKLEALSKNRILNDSFSNLTAFETREGSYTPVSNSSDELDAEFRSKRNVRYFGIAITVIGTVLLDYCADVIQSPSRAYLLDITLPVEHASGLAVLTLNSGFGAAIGYAIAAVEWDITLWKNVLENQVIVASAIIGLFYLLFLSCLFSFPEVPLPLLKNPAMFREFQEKMKEGQSQWKRKFSDTETSLLPQEHTQYSSMKETDAVPESRNVQDVMETVETSSTETKSEVSHQASLKEYLKSIVFMPKSLRILCLTNFFFGMALVPFAIFFTDFVGENVFEGDPRAPKDSESYRLYEEGVRLGSWAMAFASLTCATYATVIEDLVRICGARSVYVGAAMVYSVGMLIVAITRHKVSAIILSSTAGVLYTTVSTVPYMLISRYHTSLKNQESSKKSDQCTRGIGTDIAAVVSTIVLAQCIVSSSMGTVVEMFGSSTITVYTAVLFGACAAISATEVTYFDK